MSTSLSSCTKTPTSSLQTLPVTKSPSELVVEGLRPSDHMMPEKPSANASGFPAVKTVPDFLAKQNGHPRDEFITFEEGPHIYTIHGKQGYTSVTTFVHHHFASFDSETIIKNILSSKRHQSDPSYKYFQMTHEQIDAMWEENRVRASTAGTNMHYDIECYFNEQCVVNDSIEYTYFQNFCDDYVNIDGQRATRVETPKGSLSECLQQHTSEVASPPVKLSGLKPYRTEWMVYHEELKICGSIDMIFENEDGTLQIYDWKRCKSIEYESFGGATGNLPCISHMPDTNFWHYSLQLNMYRRILQDKYDKKVTGLYLMCLHPDNYNKNYQRIEVPFMDEEISELLDIWSQKKEI